MRNSTRLRFFLAVASLTSLAGLFVACGDDDGGSLPPPDAGQETSRPETSTPDTGTPDTGNPDTGTPDTGPGYDAGPTTILEAGPEYEGGIACVVGGQIEQEVNDDPDASNELRKTADAGCLGKLNGALAGPGCTRCGVIFDSDLDAGADAGDAGLGGTEVEYLSFVIEPGTERFYLDFAGNVTLVVTVEGNPTEYVITPTSAPTLPYTAGKRYFVEVKSNTGMRTPWRVTLFEDRKQ